MTRLYCCTNLFNKFNLAFDCPPSLTVSNNFSWSRNCKTNRCSAVELFTEIKVRFIVRAPPEIRQKVLRPVLWQGTISRYLTLLTYVETIQTAEKQNIVIQHLNCFTIKIHIFPTVSLEIFRIQKSEFLIIIEIRLLSNRTITKSFYYFSHSLIFSNWRILHFWDT